MKKIIAFSIVLLVSSLTQAQVIVAPTVLFMSDQSRFGTFVVMNRSNTPQEISISFRFGFPESDSAGITRMEYSDTAMERLHSCQEWLKGFPQKFIVNPGQQQVVRLLVAPPTGIADGEYLDQIGDEFHPSSQDDRYGQDRHHGEYHIRARANYDDHLQAGECVDDGGFAKHRN